MPFGSHDEDSHVDRLLFPSNSHFPTLSLQAPDLGSLVAALEKMVVAQVTGQPDFLLCGCPSAHRGRGAQGDGAPLGTI